MQYKIPQNVGIEDKIVGPLTLRQLIILAAGCGISYVLFAILSKIYELNILEYIIIAIPALLAVAFALIKINDIPLIKFLFLFLEFSIKPKKRLWDHRGIAPLVSPDLTEGKAKAAAVSEEEDMLSKKAKKAANLKNLTQVLDSGGFEHLEEVEHKDVDISHDDDLVTQAYFGHKENKTENMYWRTKKAHIEMLNIFANLPVTQLKKGTKEAAIAQAEVVKVKEEVAKLKKEKKAAPKLPSQGAVPFAGKAKPTETRAPTASRIQVPAPKTEIVKSAPKPPAEAVSVPPALSKKKPRKRKRPVPQPVRKNNQVNTISKGKPAEYLPTSPPKKTVPQTSTPQSEKYKQKSKEGEFDIRELEKGEIEIKLD